MDEISVVVRLVDEASSQMQSLVANMEGAMSSISSTATDASSSLTEIGSSASDAANSISEVGNAANETSDAVSTAANSAEELNSATSNITSTNIDEVAKAATEASTSLNSTSTSAEELATSLASVNATDISSAAASADSLKGSLDKTAESAQELTNNSKEATTTLANTGGSVVGLAAIAGALGAVTAGMEMAARDATNLNTTFQKMANAKMPEPAVRSFVASLVSAKLPLEDVIGYMKLLKQAGVSSAEGLRAGIIGLNNLALATGTTRDEISRFANSLIVMGIRLDEVHKAYNAVAYAQANIVGGFATYIKWMEKFDSEFRKLGLNIDQTAVLIAAATKKFGGGRAAYTGLSQALKECNGDLSVLEQKLGMQPGTLARASEMTSKYAGTIDRKSKIEKNNVTIMQMLQTELDKLKIRFSWLIGPITNVGGLISGLVGLYSVYLTYQSAVSMAASVQALSEMTKAGATGASTAATSQNIVVTTLQAAANRVAAIGTALYTAALEGNLISLIAQTVATKAATAAQWLFNAAMSANPIMWVVIAIGALISILVVLWSTNEGFRNAVMGLWEKLKGFAQWLWDGLVSAFNKVKDALKPVIDALKWLYDVIVKDLQDAWSNLTEGASNAWNYLQGFGAWLSSQFKSEWDGFVKGVSDGGKSLTNFLSQFKSEWDGFVKGVSDGGKSLTNFLKPVTDAANSFFDFAKKLIFSSEGAKILTDKLGPLGLYISFLVTPLRTVKFALDQLKMAWDQWTKSAEGKKVLSDLKKAFDEGREAIQELWRALQPAMDALHDAFNELMRALKPLHDVSSSTKDLSNSMDDAKENIEDTNSPLQLFVDIIKNVAWILENFVVPALKILAAILRALKPVIEAIAWIIQNVIVPVLKILADIIAFLWPILMKMGDILKQLWEILVKIGQILYKIILFLVTLPSKMREIGHKMGSEFMKALQNLPSQLGGLLRNTILKISSFGSQARGLARKIGSDILNGVINFVKQLPGRVYQEFLKIGDRIRSAGPYIVRQARQIGSDILNAVLGTLGIRSPGYIYREISGEFDRVLDYITKIKTKAGDAASEFANSIKSNAQVELPQPIKSNAQVELLQPTLPQAPATQETRTQMNEVTKTGLEAVNTTTQQGMAAINNTTNTGLQTIISTWTGIKETTTKTQAAMTNTQTITKSAMSTMVNTTKNAMDSMKNGFNSMKNEVISAASKAKSGVVSHIDTLSANIKRFYRLVTNPGAGGPAGGPVGSSIRKIAGAGAPVSRKIMTTPSLKLGFGALPEPLTPSEPLKSPSIHDISGSRKAQKIAEEFYRMLSCPSCFAYGAGGGWDYSDEWISWIKKQIGSYRVSILPGLNIKAGDFVTYPPKGIAGNLASFIAVMSAIIGRTRYAFYYGSSGLSVAQLLARGYFNCYDGARIVVAYANAFGLPAYMSCGLSWAGIPHCAANVAGMWFDTTAFQHGYGWTSPKVSGYGGPTSSAEIERLFKPKETTRTVDVNLRHDLSFNIEVKASGSVSKETVTQALKEAEIPDKVKRNLLEDELFRSRLLKVIGDAISREKRAYGV